MLFINMVEMANIRESDIDINIRPSNDPEMGVDDGFEGGVDDGFSSGPTDSGVGEGIDDGLSSGRTPFNGNRPGRRPSRPVTPSGRGGGFPLSPGHGGYNPLPADPSHQPGNPIDVNLYQTKKTVAQGMMDIALLTANANQLRYVLETGKYGTNGTLYYLNVSLISVSIVLQLVVGIILIFMGRYDVSHKETARKADILNSVVVVAVFFITVINVFISSFGVDPLEGVEPEMMSKIIASKNPGL